MCYFIYYSIYALADIKEAFTTSYCDHIVVLKKKKVIWGRQQWPSNFIHPIVEPAELREDFFSNSSINSPTP